METVSVEEVKIHARKTVRVCEEFSTETKNKKISDGETIIKEIGTNNSFCKSIIVII